MTLYVYPAHTLHNTQTEPRYKLWTLDDYSVGVGPRNKCTALEGGVDHQGGPACVGAGSVWETSIPAPQF